MAQPKDNNRTVASSRAHRALQRVGYRPAEIKQLTLEEREQALKDEPIWQEDEFPVKFWTEDEFAEAQYRGEHHG